MSTTMIFPSLNGWEATRDTLHSYSQVIGVVPRAHAKFHPRWWHISLKVEPDGMVTDRMALPQGGDFWLKMDLRQHKLHETRAIRFRLRQAGAGCGGGPGPDRRLRAW
jgi:hypothetical protein